MCYKIYPIIHIVGGDNCIFLFLLLYKVCTLPILKLLIKSNPRKIVSENSELSLKITLNKSNYSNIKRDLKKTWKFMENTYINQTNL